MREKLLRERAQLVHSAEAIRLSANGQPLSASQRASFDDLLRRVDLINLQLSDDPNATIERQRSARPGSDASTEWSGADEWSQPGEFFRAVAQASYPGSAVDPRLAKTRALGMSEDLASGGGFLVGHELSSDLLQKVFSSGQIASRVRRVPLTLPNSNGIKIPYVDESSRTSGNRLGGVSVSWPGEAGSVTASRPKIGSVELSLKKMQAVAYASDELMADTAALGNILMEAFRQEMVFELEDKILNGSGAGVPLGVMNSNCLVTVSKESGQATGTLNSTNVGKMLARLHPASWPNSVWIANVSILPQLLRMAVEIKNVAGTENVGGSSGALFYDPNTQKLLGRQVIFAEQTAALSSLGDILLADMSQFLLIEKQMQAVSSMHVAFLTDEMCFRFTWRCDGQAAWRTALTPAHGTDTVSPFVTLQAR